MARSRGRLKSLSFNLSHPDLFRPEVLFRLGEGFHDKGKEIGIKPVNPPCPVVFEHVLCGIDYAGTAFPSRSHLDQDLRDIGCRNTIFIEKPQHQFIVCCYRKVGIEQPVLIVDLLFHEKSGMGRHPAPSELIPVESLGLPVPYYSAGIVRIDKEQIAVTRIGSIAGERIDY